MSYYKRKNSRSIAIFGILFLLVFSAKAQSSLFDDTDFHEIRVTSTEANFWDLLDQDYDNFLQNDVPIPYHSVTVEIDGNIVENVGIRQKGFSSNFFAFTTKKPLKIDFGEYQEDLRYDGVKKINLANGMGDPAIVKDKIAYDMYRLHGIPAPRVSSAKVYIQGEYWGIYSIIEQIDIRFLQRNFADKNGNLWKNKGNSNLEWSGSNPDNYTFELKTNEEENDWTKFIEFVDFINNSSDTDFQDTLEDIFDLDEYLRILAVDILINNWDSYIEHGRNWYLYHEPNTNKMHWLPWDYNFAFDREPNGFGDFPVILNNLEKVLIARILDVPEFRVRYLNYMCEILSVNFTESRLFPLLDAKLDLIDDDWSQATNNFYTLLDVENSIDGATWHGNPINGGPVQGFKRFIQDRTTSMEEELSGESHTCIPLEIPINPQDVVINEFMAQNMDGSPWSDQDDEFDDWIELYNNTDVDISLNNYFLSDSPSFIHKWEFPDVSIPANGYLIVWADKDPQQNGLHTKFNIDKDGDELFLSYLDGTIIDSVDFSDEQGENKSLSRIPNGTGDFIVADVTFNAENTNVLGINDQAHANGIRIHPNPTSTTLNIDFKDIIASKIIVNDMIGREVYNSQNNASSFQINVSTWSSGLYVVRLISNTFNISQKVIIK